MFFDKNQILRELGLGEMVDRHLKGRCPFCSYKIDTGIMTLEEKEECELTGLCVDCQSNTFDGMDSEPSEILPTKRILI